MTVWEWVFRLITLAGAVIQVCFVVKFSGRPWRQSAPTKALMAKSSTLAVCLVALELHWLTTDPPRPLWVSIPLALAIATAITAQFVVLLRSPHGPHYLPPSQH